MLGQTSPSLLPLPMIPDHNAVITCSKLRFVESQNRSLSMGIFAIDAVVRYLQWTPRDSLGFHFSASC
jgi:hypothetical protein